jgi:DNA-binding GntR family transcriptional regulator
MPQAGAIVVVNAGSSSVKFSLFDESGKRPVGLSQGADRRLYTGTAHFAARDTEGGLVTEKRWDTRVTHDDAMVVSQPQRGFQAAPISVADLRDLTMVRVEVESLCLRRAIAVGTVEWEAGLVAAFHRLSRTPERVASDPMRSADEWADAHAAFHLALVDGANSPWLLRLHGQLYAQSERYRRLSIPLDMGERDVGGEHHAILDAVLKRDADCAVALLTRHLGATTEILLAAGIERYAAKHG